MILRHCLVRPLLFNLFIFSDKIHLNFSQIGAIIYLDLLFFGILASGGMLLIFIFFTFTIDLLNCLNFTIFVAGVRCVLVFDLDLHVFAEHHHLRLDIGQSVTLEAVIRISRLL